MKFSNLGKVITGNDYEDVAVTISFQDRISKNGQKTYIIVAKFNPSYLNSLNYSKTVRPIRRVEFGNNYVRLSS